MLLDASDITEAERSAMDMDQRPGLWADEHGADLRKLTQHETDMLIRREIWSRVAISEVDEVKAVIGEPRALELPGTPINGHLTHIRVGRQRGGIDSDPMVRLLAFRSWGDRDVQWFALRCAACAMATRSS